MHAPIVVSKGTIEPITLDFLRSHLKLVPEGSPATHPDDEYVGHLLTVAREYVEEYSGITIVPAVLELRLDYFPGTESLTYARGDMGVYAESNRSIILPGAPVRGIESVSCVDSQGIAQPLDPSCYSLNNVPLYPVLTFPSGISLPSVTVGSSGAIRIRYHAGHTDSESPNDYPLPARLRHAIMLMVTHWYENRSSVEFATAAEVPFSAVALMKQTMARRGLA